MLHFLLSIGDWFANTWDIVRLTWTGEEIVRLENELGESDDPNEIRTIRNKIAAHQDSYKRIRGYIRLRKARHHRAMAH